MAAPAIYLAFAIVVLGALSALAETVALKTMGAFNRGTLLSATLDNAAKDVLMQTRTWVSTNGITVAPTITPTQPAASPGLGIIAVTLPYGFQSFSATSLSGSSTTESQNVEADSVADTVVSGAPALTAAPIAPRYSVEIDATSTTPDGSKSDAREVCTVRTYPTPPYADIAACVPRQIDSTAKSQIGADTTGTTASATTQDTTTHKYDLCTDTSGSGACAASNATVVTANKSVIDRTAITTQSQSVSGAASW